MGCGSASTIAMRQRDKVENLLTMQSILVPSVYYGGELWGMHSPQAAMANKARPDLEQTHAYFLGRICGVMLKQF